MSIITLMMHRVMAFYLSLLEAMLWPYKVTLRLTYICCHITADAIWAVMKKLLRPNKGKNIPGPVALPFIGSMWIYNKYFGLYSIPRIQDAYRSMFQKYGQVFKEEAFMNHLVINTCSAQDIDKINKILYKYPPRPPNAIVNKYRQSKPERYHGGGLTNEQGEDWRRLRKSMTKDMVLFSVTKKLIPDVNEMAMDYMAGINALRDPDTGRVQDIIELNRKLGYESTCLLGLGCRVGFLDDEPHPNVQRLSNATNKLFEALNEANYSFPMWRYYPNSTYKNLAEAEEELYEIACEYLSETVRTVEDSYEPDAAHAVLIGILRSAELDEKDKKTSIVDLVSAGMNTIGNTLSLLLYLIAKNPDAQRKLYDEIYTMLEPNKPISAKYLHSAMYLQACVDEYFRLLPAAPRIARILENDINLSGFQVPAGAVVVCHTSIACQNEEYFYQADKFIPERWIPSERKANPKLELLHPTLNSPFGFNRRMCPGKKFAEQVLHIFLATVIRRYEVRCEQDLKVESKFLEAPVGPLTIYFVERA